MTGLTILDAGLVLIVGVLWKDNFYMRKTIIDMLEKTVEAKVRNIETLGQIEDAIEKQTEIIERFREKL